MVIQAPEITALDHFSRFRKQLSEAMAETYLEQNFQEEVEEICQKLNMKIQEMIEYIPQCEDDRLIGLANMWLDASDDVTALKEKLDELDGYFAARDQDGGINALKLNLAKAEQSVGKLFDNSNIETLISL